MGYTIDEQKTKYVELFNKLWDSFSSFQVLAVKGRDEEAFWDDFHCHTTNEFDEVHLYGGMSRYAFVLEDCDYVVKFGVNPRGNEDCAREEELYQKAVESEIGHMFVKVERFTTYGKLQLYFCERADADEDFAISTHMSYRQLTDYSDSKQDSEEQVEDIFNSFYGWRDVGLFYEFCADNNINDLHLNNIGFDGETVKCIDYAGY